jgi:hypothetical protein
VRRGHGPIVLSIPGRCAQGESRHHLSPGCHQPSRAAMLNWTSDKAFRRIVRRRVLTRVVVSAKRPEAYSDLISKPLVYWELTETISDARSVIPSPRLVDLRQGPGPSLSWGGLPAQPCHVIISRVPSRSTRLHISRGYPSGSTRLQPGTGVKTW